MTFWLSTLSIEGRVEWVIEVGGVGVYEIDLFLGVAGQISDYHLPKYFNLFGNNEKKGWTTSFNRGAYSQLVLPAAVCEWPRRKYLQEVQGGDQTDRSIQSIPGSCWSRIVLGGRIWLHAQAQEERTLPQVYLWREGGGCSLRNFLFYLDLKWGGGQRCRQKVQHPQEEPPEVEQGGLWAEREQPVGCGWGGGGQGADQNQIGWANWREAGAAGSDRTEQGGGFQGISIMVHKFLWQKQGEIVVACEWCSFILLNRVNW